jgi:hypothetical protein
VDLLHELGRFWYWLNQSSGAIQAASSVITLCLTAILLRSLKLSKQTLDVSRQQLTAGLLPVLTIEFKRSFITDLEKNGVRSYSRDLNFLLSNDGDVSFRVISISVETTQGHNEIGGLNTTAQAFPSLSGIVLRPKARVFKHLELDLPRFPKEVDEHLITVECQDLMFIKSHRFTLGKDGFLRHHAI